MNTEQKTIKKIGVGMILGWILGLLFIIAGIFMLFSSVLQGIFYILAGAMIFPPVWNKIKGKWNFELSGVLKVILFIVLIIIGSVCANSKEGQKVTDNVSPQNQPSVAKEVKAYKVGEPIVSDNMEIIVTSVKERASVGTDFLKENASEGGTLVAVNWQYKNISKKPIGMFSQPSMSLVDAGGVEYSADIGKTSSYATEVKLDSKIVSDLNPDITVKDAKVFEVSKSQYNLGGWSVIIKADGKDYVVNIK